MRSLRTRLLLAYVGLILVGFTVLALVVGRQISTGTVQDFANSLAEQAQIVARALKETVEESDDHSLSQNSLSSMLGAYAERSGAEVRGKRRRVRSR